MTLNDHLRARQFAMRTAFVLFLGAFVGGCQTPAGNLAGPTQVDRLMAAYPELQRGRLLILADFEDPRHMDIIELMDLSGHAQCVLDRTHGRPATGAGCIAIHAAASVDTVVISNRPRAEWSLKRDWRDYDLLMLSVEVDQRDLAVEISVAGGSVDAMQTAYTTRPLKRGWNDLALDLAEVAGHVPLDDVREIRLSVTGSTKPVGFRVDNLLLAGNRKDLFGTSQTDHTGLYVQRIGRRRRVGARGPQGSFELTFANGQVVEWYNTAADPHRLSNLVRGTTLGPTPLVIGGANPSDAVVADTRIVEMNSVRVVVVCEWRFIEQPGRAGLKLERQPYQRWTYTIYPTGQVYVAIEATAKTDRWAAPQFGLVVNLAQQSERPWETFVVSPSGSDEADSLPAYATARNVSPDAFVLFAAHNGFPMRMTKERSGTNVAETPGIAELIALMPTNGRRVQRWASHLYLGSNRTVTAAEARARAAEYSTPRPLDLELGTPISGTSDELGSSGFDREAGCFVLEPESGQVRLVIGTDGETRFSPAFKILNPAGLDAWVYVDHQLHSPTATDRDGHLIFQLPGNIDDSTLVEVLLRRPGPPQGP